MKNIVNKFIFVTIYLLGVAIAFAAPKPPPPNYKRPAPPQGLPIDENISFLVIIAIMFGIYIIYRHRLKTKAPF
jgi:hypothetical protein